MTLQEAAVHIPLGQDLFDTVRDLVNSAVEEGGRW
jgi:hypothetical protein